MKDFTDKLILEKQPCISCGRLKHYMRMGYFPDKLNFCISIPADDHQPLEGYEAFVNDAGEKDFRVIRHSGRSLLTSINKISPKDDWRVW